MHDAIIDAGLSKEQYENNPRAGGILGQGGTSIPDVGETLAAVSAGTLKKIGPYRVTRTMGSTVSAVYSRTLLTKRNPRVFFSLSFPSRSRARTLSVFFLSFCEEKLPRSLPDMYIYMCISSNIYTHIHS